MIPLIALPVALLALQQGGAIPAVAERLAGRVGPEVAAAAEQLAARAAARGLPLDPMIQKAIEGSAKGVASDRVIIALHVVVTQLDTAAAALREAGLGSDTMAVTAGGFALTAGLSGRDIAQLARASRSAADVTVALRVAGTLTAIGVPADETVTLVSTTLRSGQPAAELLSLPGRVRAEMARGLGPAQAAAGLSRAAANEGRRGPPPGRGQPPNRPQPPPHP